MGLRAWWAGVQRAFAKRRYIDDCLARMDQGRASIGLPRLTREQRATLVVKLSQAEPTRIVDGRSVWRKL